MYEIHDSGLRPAGARAITCGMETNKTDKQTPAAGATQWRSVAIITGLSGVLSVVGLAFSSWQLIGQGYFADEHADQWSNLLDSILFNGAWLHFFLCLALTILTWVAFGLCLAPCRNVKRMTRKETAPTGVAGKK